MIATGKLSSWSREELHVSSYIVYLLTTVRLSDNHAENHDNWLPLKTKTTYSCHVYSPLHPPTHSPPAHTHTDTLTTSSRYLWTPLPSQRSNVQPEKRRKWQQKHENTWKRKRMKRKNLGTNPNTETSSRTYSHTLSLAGSARTIHLYILC